MKTSETKPEKAPAPCDLQLFPQSATEIVLTRIFDAPRELVFRAFTEPDFIKRWLYGADDHVLEICEIDLQIGGHHRYVWRFPDGREMGMGGVYHDIIRPEKLVFTEVWDENWTGGEVISTLLLIEQSDKTLFTLTLTYASEEARDAILKSPMEQGAGQSYARLNALLTELL